MNNRTDELGQYMAVLGFSELESKIYITLLGGGTMSAYQIAKKIDISRPSVYNALEQMIRKGMAVLIPNDTALYAAQQPELLLAKLRGEFTRSADAAEQLLKRCTPPDYSEQYANLTGLETILLRAKGIMRDSRTEIYLNTDMPLDSFNQELRSLAARNLRTVVYSFYDIGNAPDGGACEIFTHGRPLIPDRAPTRLMVVSDNAMALIAGPDREGIWQGTVTGNRLFVKIISEHIHNDIYLLKLRNRFGREIYENLHIFTDYENRNRQ